MRIRLIQVLMGLLILTFCSRFYHTYQTIIEYWVGDSDIKVDSSIFITNSFAQDGTASLASDPEIMTNNNLTDQVSETTEESRSVNYPTSLEHGNNSEIYNLNHSEIQLLKELSIRRKIIEDSRQDLLIQLDVVTAAGNKVDNKIQELKILREEVKKLIVEYNIKEDSKINSLVKIYENMKPKDAANIFDDLDMNVLLQVISNMREAKVAPILSNMNPDRAREVSMKFAERKKINLP